MELKNKVNLDDIIKLSHLEIVDDLIKNSADALIETNNPNVNFDVEKQRKLLVISIKNYFLENSLKDIMKLFLTSTRL